MTNTTQQQTTSPVQEQKRQSPSLPSLYFANRAQQQSLRAERNSSVVELPAELLHRCLVQYSDWGDLAKLANVQKGWCNVMMDAANQDPASKWELAQASLEGTRGLQQNYKLAFSLFHDLANVELSQDSHKIPLEKEGNENDNQQQQQGSSNACFSPAMKAIAQCYLEGKGVEKDTEAGVAWLRSAYNMGDDIDAAHDLAMIYEYGKFSVENDIFAAAEWLKKAANGGHIEAMAELGLCYELGCGVEQSDTEALDWYTKAANLGHITSKFSVAEAFEEARGVPQSDEEACIWYYKAAIEGDHDSKMALRRLEEIARIVVPGVRAILDV